MIHSRFTPTGVGTMCLRAARQHVRLVHPHGRGDNSLWRGGGQWLDGSPPRAWGQWRQDVGPHRSSRFTPTGVGTILAAAVGVAGGAVHPHGRGDNLIRDLPRVSQAGSPPRAWGQYLRLRHSNAIRLHKQASKSCSASGRYSYQKEPLYLYELTICGSATP